MLHARTIALTIALFSVSAGSVAASLDATFAVGRLRGGEGRTKVLRYRVRRPFCV